MKRTQAPTIGALSLLFLALFLIPACEKTENQTTAASASGSVSVAASSSARRPDPQLRCRPVRSGASFTLGEPGPAAAGTDPEVALPFAVEVGEAVAAGPGYAVSALRSQDGGTQAVIAMTDRIVTRGRIVELAEVHGSVEPPKLAAQGRHLVAVLHGNDAGSETLRVVTLRNFDSLDSQADVIWGAEVPQGRGQSSAFDVELGAEQGVLVWDRVDKAKGKSAVLALTFDPEQPGKATKPRKLSTPGDDAESPRLIRRPGGFWLTWISHGPLTRPDKKASSEAKFDNLESVMELHPRRLKIVPLDQNGSPSGEPQLLTDEGAHVLVYDVAPTAEGGAVLAWRDDPTSPGAEGNRVSLAAVAPDGSIKKQFIEDEQLGVGVPSLLFDAPRAKKKSESRPAHTWLTLAGVSGMTRLAMLDPAELRLGELQENAAIGSGELLVVQEQRFLVATPRRMAIQLVGIQCELPPKKPRTGAKAKPSR